jgi:hypothetical protein
VALRMSCVSLSGFNRIGTNKSGLPTSIRLVVARFLCFSCLEVLAFVQICQVGEDLVA